MKFKMGPRPGALYMGANSGSGHGQSQARYMEGGWLLFLPTSRDAESS